ncbi:hypothetical protein GmHk_19G054899 [Glycine max]|nr:hypothetical protein GmHk_19G054899 [Glycine max]
MNTFLLSLIHQPSNIMKPLPTTLLSTIKESLFEMHSRPPAALHEGSHSQVTLLSPHKYRQSFLSIDSFLVSWMHRISILCDKVCFLMADHLIPLPNPLELKQTTSWLNRGDIVHTADFISTSENLATRLSFFPWPREGNWTPSRVGLEGFCSENLCLK